jgi:hypothetical protein
MSNSESAHLCVSEVCDCVPVCGDEEAAGVLPDAQRGVLDLVVVDVAVKAHHHGANLRWEIGNKGVCQWCGERAASAMSFTQCSGQSPPPQRQPAVANKYNVKQHQSMSFTRRFVRHV